MSDTYLVTDIEREGWFVRAPSPNHALAQHCDELGISLLVEGADGYEVERAEHMDGLPLTDYMALAVGGFGTTECACGRTIWRIEGRLVSEDDAGAPLEPHLVGADLFCSTACAAALYEVTEDAKATQERIPILLTRGQAAWLYRDMKFGAESIRAHQATQSALQHPDDRARAEASAAYAEDIAAQLRAQGEGE